MKLAVVLNVHGNTEVVLDAIDAIRAWVTNDILVIIDGQNWEWGRSTPMPAFKMQGLIHAFNKNSYRNEALGLKCCYEVFPNADWYCYVEYDTLFASDKFKDDLAKGSDEGIWCMANGLKSVDIKLPYMNFVLNDDNFVLSHWFLGCCVFFNRKFMEKMNEVNFFNRLLELTNGFTKGFFPEMDEKGICDISEYLYPSLAVHLGGKVKQFANWDSSLLGWAGDYKKYPMRPWPELDEKFLFPEAAIMHPLKKFDSSIRQFHRIKRLRKKNANQGTA